MERRARKRACSRSDDARSKPRIQEPHTILLFNDYDIDGSAEGGWVDRVPGLRNGTSETTDILHLLSGAAADLSATSTRRTRGFEPLVAFGFPEYLSDCCQWSGVERRAGRGL